MTGDKGPDRLSRLRKREFMSERKLAVIFPGIGYHKDKPLLYYSTKLVQNFGYEIMHIDYHDLPGRLRGNRELMEKAVKIAYGQASEQLASTDLSGYEDILLIGKSIGTVVLSKYASDHGIKAGQIWYTPVEETFLFASAETVAFIGEADPMSDINRVLEAAKEKNVRLYTYPGGNHSLECGDVDTDIANLREVMKITEQFIKHRTER